MDFTATITLDQSLTADDADTIQRPTLPTTAAPTPMIATSRRNVRRSTDW